jgi:Fe-S-cluster formation regulator IscX/YfhJ
MSPSLNATQRAAVVIALSGFERDLRQAEMWLRGQKQEGVLYRTSLQLSPTRRVAALTEIAGALEIIARLVERLGLQPTEESLASKIAAAMTINWADLIDVGSAKLKRYGPVDPDLHRTLDPETARLAELALSISSLVREVDDSERSDDAGGPAG